MLWLMSISELQLISSMLGLGHIHPASIVTNHPTEILVIVVAGPVIEELIFRYGCIRLLSLRLPSWAAVVGSAAVFAASHTQYAVANALQLGTLANIFSGGVALGAAYVCSGTIWAPIAIHVAYNAMTFLIDDVALSWFSAGSRFQGPVSGLFFLFSAVMYAFLCREWLKQRRASQTPPLAV